MSIVDFGVATSMSEAALYEMPFEHVRTHVRPERVLNERAAYAEKWWCTSNPARECARPFLG